MTRHDESLRLRHMLDHALEAVEMAHGRQRSDLDKDRQFSLALLKLVEIVGEAAYRVPEQVREQHPHVAWPQIIATRHRLVHGYDNVDHRILWDIVAYDLPVLIAQLRLIVEQGQPPADGTEQR